MKIRFELKCRDSYEDIITFDFSNVIDIRGYSDRTLPKIINPESLYAMAIYLISTPEETWNKQEYQDEEETLYEYFFTKDDKVIFSVTYYREWKNGDRKYQIFIEGIAKECSLYAKLV